MATSVASGSGQLHFQEVFSRGNGCRRAYSVRNIAGRSCMPKELSWYAYRVILQFMLCFCDDICGNTLLLGDVMKKVFSFFSQFVMYDQFLILFYIDVRCFGIWYLPSRKSHYFRLFVGL